MWTPRSSDTETMRAPDGLYLALHACTERTAIRGIISTQAIISIWLLTLTPTYIQVIINADVIIITDNIPWWLLTQILYPCDCYHRLATQVIINTGTQSDCSQKHGHTQVIVNRHIDAHRWLLTETYTHKQRHTHTQVIVDRHRRTQVNWHMDIHRWLLTDIDTQVIVNRHINRDTIRRWLLIDTHR